MSENLIDESEFTKPYNPWRRFALFYGLAVIHILTFYLVMNNYVFADNFGQRLQQVFASIIVLSPLCVGLLMLMGNRQAIYVGTSVKIGALAILEIVYTILGVLISIYERGPNYIYAFILEDIKVMSIYFGVNFVIVLAISLPVARYKKKKGMQHE